MQLLLQAVGNPTLWVLVLPHLILGDKTHAVKDTGTCFASNSTVLSSTLSVFHSHCYMYFFIYYSNICPKISYLLFHFFLFGWTSKVFSLENILSKYFYGIWILLPEGWVNTLYFVTFKTDVNFYHESSGRGELDQINITFY